MKTKWPTVALGEVAEFRNGLNYRSAVPGGPIHLVGVPAFMDREALDLSRLASVTLDPVPPEDAMVRPRDLLFVRSNGNPELVGRCIRVEALAGPTAHSGFTIRARVDEARVLSRWAQLHFISGIARKGLTRGGGGTNITNLSQGALARIVIAVPPLQTQASGLRAVAALEEHEQAVVVLLAAKRRLKRALMQRLIPQCGGTKRVSLRAVTVERAERNGSRLGTERVMGVLKAKGLVPMREEVRADDLSRYKVVRPGAFAYNPMRINIGSIAHSKHEHEVLVSPDYVVFECDPAKLWHRYLDHVRHTAAWSSFVGRAGSGSVRVRIYYDHLAQFALRLPPLVEQERVAASLDALDCEVDLLASLLAALRLQKRGVMQKLLSGEIEVPEHPSPPEPPAPEAES